MGLTAAWPGQEMHRVLTARGALTRAPQASR
jgi:hypothetical protein